MDTRKKLFELRQTWNNVFTPEKLHSLDVKINMMDPNWKKERESDKKLTMKAFDGYKCESL